MAEACATTCVTRCLNVYPSAISSGFSSRKAPSSSREACSFRPHASCRRKAVPPGKCCQIRPEHVSQAKSASSAFGSRRLPVGRMLLKEALLKDMKRGRRRCDRHAAPVKAALEDDTAPSSSSSSSSSSTLDALIFDCDGVILESEDLHRRAYNATFAHFRVCCRDPDDGLKESASSSESNSVVDWSTSFYDVLQNKIGGGKPKMRWYFGENGWPTSTLFPSGPQTDEEKVVLIDSLQDWKTSKYKDLIASGEVPARPGILQLMDEARASGLKVAVCSAATKSSVVFCLEMLLGKGRFQLLDCFLAGDDVDKKKPDPTIYKIAARRLGVSPARCLVVEDSVIGLQAAVNAGMKCVITHTSSTKEQDFSAAVAVYEDLSGVSLKDLLLMLQEETVPATKGA